MIKLTVCYFYESDEIKDYLRQTKWYKWAKQSHYFNPDYIIHFQEAHKLPTNEQEWVLGDAPFNSVLWLNGIKEKYYIEETQEQIMKLIKEAK